MRKIYSFVSGDIQEAWIGESAPIPPGWHLDVNSAMEARNGLRKETLKGQAEEIKAREEDGTFKADDPAIPDVNEAWKPKRGRPRKAK